VAVGSALGALGSDTGGSIRQPAALCGVVGMKPTYGLVSRYGLIAFASSLDQIGPFTRTVADSVDLLAAVAGHDPYDATSIPGEVPDLGAGLGRGIEGLRVGVVSEMQRSESEPGVTAAVERTIAQMEAAGAKLVDVSLPSFEYALSAYYLIAPAECSANLARFDGVRYGSRVDGQHVAEMMSKTRADGFGAEVTRRILLGTYALSAGHFDAFYGQALKVRTLVRRDLAAAYEQADVLVGPTSPTTAFELGAKTADPMTMYLTDVFTIPSNLSGDPGISVPVGLDERGLPVGFQVMAPALQEPLMFQVAEAVERLAGFEARPSMVGAL
jgi:aspartyl-tRNA(Asn)/glutamyl-tRNA(Gln) amidotransferase subunit A